MNPSQNNLLFVTRFPDTSTHNKVQARVSAPLCSLDFSLRSEKRTAAPTSAVQSSQGNPSLPPPRKPGASSSSSVPQNIPRQQVPQWRRLSWCSSAGKQDLAAGTENASTFISATAAFWGCTDDAIGQQHSRQRGILYLQIYGRILLLPQRGTRCQNTKNQKASFPSFLQDRLKQACSFLGETDTLL